MAEDWAQVAADVAAGIAEAGGIAQLRRRFVTVPASPWTPGGETAITNDYPVHAALDEFTIMDRERTLIQQGDRKVLMAAPITVPARTVSGTDEQGQPVIEAVEGTANRPDTADQIVIDGLAYSIIYFQPMAPAPGGATVMWTLQARR